jgi:beta-N-acetylhexosaminidase
VILFASNVASLAALRRLTGELQAATPGGALVATDQEGGALRSVGFVGPAAAQPEQAGSGRIEALAGRTARGLRAAGVNVNLAPVADVPDGPASAMSSRSYRGSPAEVARSVGAAVRGHRLGGVGATAKHFPGLGAARASTDQAAVTIRRARPALERRDLVPFRAAIARRVPLVMVSHALYPALDARRVASQSPTIMERLLRGRLRFRGVVMTDSIEAEAVLRRSSVAVAAERSIAAGADLILMTGSASWKLVFPWLVERAERSRAFRQRVQQAAARVLRLKRELRLGQP